MIYKYIEECCVIQGQMAETNAKAKLLVNRLSSNPELVEEISGQITKLELELAEHVLAIQAMDAKI